MPEKPPSTVKKYPKVTSIKEDVRTVPPPDDLIPQDPNIHTRWVRDTRKRIAEMEKLGYTMAKKEDIKGCPGGWLEPSGTIRKGDLVAMKTIREYVEDRNAARLRELAGMDRRADEIDESAGIEERSGHTGRKNTGKLYNIPIELNKQT